MPRTALTVQQISTGGLTPSYVAADQVNGMEFVNDGDTFLHVKNTNASQRTVTVTTPRTVDGLAIADPAIVVPATTGDKMIGPFPPATFNQAGGLVYVDFDASAGVTIAAIRLG